MTNLHFTIYSTSRSGSNLIADNLKEKLNAQVAKLYREEDCPEDIDEKDSICILSRRRDIFSKTLSELLNHVHQSHSIYNFNIIKPFAVDKHLFRTYYSKNLKFFEKVDTSNFQKTVDIYFEDLISDPYYLFRQLGYNIETDYSLCPKSPYNYYSIITNVDELRKIANQVDFLHKNNLKY